MPNDTTHCSDGSQKRGIQSTELVLGGGLGRSLFRAGITDMIGPQMQSKPHAKHSLSGSKLCPRDVYTQGTSNSVGIKESDI